MECILLAGCICFNLTVQWKAVSIVRMKIDRCSTAKINKICTKFEQMYATPEIGVWLANCSTTLLARTSANQAYESSALIGKRFEVDGKQTWPCCHFDIVLRLISLACTRLFQTNSNWFFVSLKFHFHVRCIIVKSFINCYASVRIWIACPKYFHGATWNGMDRFRTSFAFEFESHWLFYLILLTNWKSFARFSKMWFPLTIDGKSKVCGTWKSWCWLAFEHVVILRVLKARWCCFESLTVVLCRFNASKYAHRASCRQFICAVRCVIRGVDLHKEPVEAVHRCGVQCHDRNQLSNDKLLMFLLQATWKLHHFGWQ